MRSTTQHTGPPRWLTAALPGTLHPMGIAVVWLREGGDYPGLTMAMERRGFVRHIIAGAPEGPERVDRLPRGVYWLAEPTDAAELLAAAVAAVTEVGEPGARVVVTSGESRWQGLPRVDEG